MTIPQNSISLAGLECVMNKSPNGSNSSAVKNLFNLNWFPAAEEIIAARRSGRRGAVRTKRRIEPMTVLLSPIAINLDGSAFLG
jgi:hypothetical protein